MLLAALSKRGNQADALTPDTKTITTVGKLLLAEEGNILLIY